MSLFGITISRMDLYVELAALLQTLESDQIPYALCGGWAMAVHGHVRATEDIDLLVSKEALPGLKKTVHRLGFSLENPPMLLSGGSLEMVRLVKVESGDHLQLDLLVVTPQIQLVWDSRQQVETAMGSVWVVNAAGLIQLKSLRRSAVDLEDISFLEKSNPSKS
jgi:hypothetical protein